MPLRKYIGILLITIAALALIRVLNISFPLTVTTYNKIPFSVSGEGKVEVVPDKATVDAGITVQNAVSIQEAQNKMNTVHNAIVEAVKQLGIDVKDIQTSQYLINPNYSYEGSVNKILGYNGQANVTVTVRNINTVNKIVQEFTRAGANNVQAAHFSVSDPEKYREEARNKAIINAKEQAQKIAKDLDINLDKISNMVESSTPGYVMPYKAESLSLRNAGGDVAPSFESGTQTITSVVTLYYETR